MPNGDHYQPTREEIIAAAEGYKREDAAFATFHSRHPTEAEEYKNHYTVFLRSAIFPIGYKFPYGVGVIVEFVLNGRPIGRLGEIEIRWYQEHKVDTWPGVAMRLVEEIQSDETGFLGREKWVANGEWSNTGKIALDVLRNEFPNVP